MKFFKYLKERWEDCDWQGRTVLALGWFTCLAILVGFGFLAYFAWPMVLFLVCTFGGLGLAVLAATVVHDYLEHRDCNRWDE